MPIIIPSTPLATINIPNSRATLEDLTVYITPVQSGTGVPSPTNIRQISGHDLVKIYVSPTTNEEDGETYNIEFPDGTNTVYSGTFNVKTKKLIVDSAIATITSSIQASGANGYGMARIGAKGSALAKEGYCNLLRFTSSSMTSAVDAYQIQNSTAYNRAQVAFRFSGISETTASATNQAINAKLTELQNAGTPLQVVYYLAEPIEIDFTSVPSISFLLGTNNIWSDSGNISLEYTDGIRPVIKLNDVDMTEYFTPTGMEVSYVKVQGGNGGIYLSGDRDEDILAWKAVVKLTCMPLSDNKQYDVLQKVMSADPTLYYYDPLTKAYKTIHYMASIEQMKHRGIGGTGMEFWTGLVITAEEK